MSSSTYNAHVDIASRANPQNQEFFKCQPDAQLFATQINESFTFTSENHPLSIGLISVKLLDYDVVWLRLPPPLHEPFLRYLDLTFSHALIINNPLGILKTGSKEFLMHFESLCPPMQLCHNLEDILTFKNRFPIVLKPFREYGGKGIIKIDGDNVWKGSIKIPLEQFIREYSADPISYLAVKYLKHVDQGDKRIVVINGEIIGASLRLPREGSWICNVAMGGSSNMTHVVQEERDMVESLNSVLSKLGIVMYGIDTLVSDEGYRILSEINTTSIGGVPQMEDLTKEPLVEKSIDLLWAYINQELN
jgi:glutathione synthase